MDFKCLMNVGINTDNALKRFMGNETFYKRMLSKFLDDDNFLKLTKAVSCGNTKEALISAHTLKGISGNLSMERLYVLFSKQVELMRNEKWNEAFQMMPEITENYHNVTTTLKKWLEI